MALQIYNTLSGKKEPFEPITAGKVGMYVCGPTVYDMAHVGHARCYVAFDTIVRYLRRRNDVTHVSNFTDVDDKIIKRAGEIGEPPFALATRFIGEFRTDMDLLGVAEPDVAPKVTEHIPEIVAMVERLIDNGYGYEAEGDVYYPVSKMKGYGKLGRRNLDDMEAGARVDIDEKKRHPMDFALWKAAKPGEPSWDSPWGAGRPGWHIECSAMSSKYLGETFDIHGGGKDLIFPHHENEIAQSEAANDKTFARVWMHNGFVNIDNEKMSKSLGNFFTIRDVLEKFDPQALRYFLLTTSYRSPISFSDQTIKEAEGRIKYVYETLQRLDSAVSDGPSEPPHREPWVAEIVSGFESAMDDDFNTAKALGELSEVFKLVNDVLDRPGDADTDGRTLRAARVALLNVGRTLGLFVEDPNAVLERLASRRQADAGVDPAEIETLIQARADAREAKDFPRADAIRDELASKGVVIKDTASGTVWEMA